MLSCNDPHELLLEFCLNATPDQHRRLADMIEEQPDASEALVRFACSARNYADQMEAWEKGQANEKY